jgi:hypothetical protein
MTYLESKKVAGFDATEFNLAESEFRLAFQQLIDLDLESNKRVQVLKSVKSLLKSVLEMDDILHHPASNPGDLDQIRRRGAKVGSPEEFSVHVQQLSEISKVFDIERSP